ncbi:hypothetical protein [Streptomyces sp. OR43]|uniref:hypothetical protein n=1 Tax=Streptomyces sp. or43 TaxID=2478957 RepID=UPI0011CEB75A|nr:hypothetical protein [Streptomyces sp. or43]TXS35720.1 hypothetical protein EAO72_19060 [Streptomyces sp. or43]
MSGNPFDARDVRRLQHHLLRGIPQARRDTRAVVARGALNIKTEWRANARISAPKHAPYYPRTVNFDVLTFGPDQVLAIIGPDKGSQQGALGNILEYGSVKNPPHNDGGRALINETPRFEAQMALILQRGLTWW